MWHFRKLAAANKVLSVKRYTYYRSSGTLPIYTHIRKSTDTGLSLYKYTIKFLYGPKTKF